jgi:hypothetical protein
MHQILQFLLSGIRKIMILPNLLPRFMILTSTLRSISIPRPNPLSKPHLRLNPSNEFHITIFSDLHYGEEEDGFGIDQDINSTRVINKVLDAEAPDFVILSPSHLRHPCIQEGKKETFG